jgi:hypothetical protein
MTRMSSRGVLKRQHTLRQHASAYVSDRTTLLTLMARMSSRGVLKRHVLSVKAHSKALLRRY